MMRAFNGMGRRYLYSGWAFFIPYLATYLLYYLTKWPVNPVGHVQIGGSSAQLAPTTWIPCLLHVYWALHALHIILVGITVYRWWASRSTRSNFGHPSTQPAPLGCVLVRVAPWALLALIFYIPGVYLEWPSDLWEHLRRINEWRALETVGAHSSWSKSAYFIPYSLLGRSIGLPQLFWLNFYYTGISLLLCWQYYRLSIACGLNNRASMVFVIVQALLFGNSTFSFYRYYGISSSIYAQLGAIALIRIALEFASFDTFFFVKNQARRIKYKGAPASSPTRYAEENPEHWRPSPNLRPTFWHTPSIIAFLLSSGCLATLTTFNHVQGLGLIIIGVAAVTIWRLIEWKRTARWWLLGGLLITNILFLWLYNRHPIIENYRTEGWLNVWYGFNILDFGNPAADRLQQIIGCVGVLNLACAILLIAENSFVAIISILPIIGLLSPCLSIPLTQMLAPHYESGAGITTFQRFSFVIPLGLAGIAAYGKIYERYIKNARSTAILALLGFATTLLSLNLAVLLSASKPFYNRLWHTISITESDLKIGSSLKTNNSIARIRNLPAARLITPTGYGFALEFSAVPNIYIMENRTIHSSLPPASRTTRLIRGISVGPNDSISTALIAPKTNQLTSWRSLAAQLSTHWYPQEVPLQCAGTQELEETARLRGYQLISDEDLRSYLFKSPQRDQLNSRNPR
ncbi:MAG: hypothetical protein QM760_13695 [Nibricoccus sp.]